MILQRTSEQLDRHREALRRELGDSVVAALADDDITEVMLNADGRLWLDSRSRGLVTAGVSIEADRAAGLISTIAGLLGRVVGADQPILEAELPLDGSRIQAILPPVAAAPLFAIRKRAGTLLPLSCYVRDGGLSQPQAEALSAALSDRRNILVAGGPGSGKTTFVNALLHQTTTLDSRVERFCILEDTYELRCSAPNQVTLHSSEAVGLRDLVRACLRLRPDRIVIGEVRGAEAYDLIKAWNTGNPGGCATIHANSALSALDRLDQLAQEAGVPSQARLVAATIHVVVYMARLGSCRQVRELVAVRGLERGGGYHVEPLVPSTS